MESKPQPKKYQYVIGELQQLQKDSSGKQLTTNKINKILSTYGVGKKMEDFTYDSSVTKNSEKLEIIIKQLKQENKVDQEEQKEEQKEDQESQIPMSQASTKATRKGSQQKSKRKDLGDINSQIKQLEELEQENKTNLDLIKRQQKVNYKDSQRIQTLEQEQQEIRDKLTQLQEENYIVSQQKGKLQDMFNERLKKGLEKINRIGESKEEDILKDRAKQGFKSFQQNQELKQFLEDFQSSDSIVDKTNFRQYDKFDAQQMEQRQQAGQRRENTRRTFRDLIRKLRLKEGQQNDQQDIISKFKGFHNKLAMQQVKKSLQTHSLMKQLSDDNVLSIDLLRKLDSSLNQKLSQLTDQQKKQFYDKSENGDIAKQIETYIQDPITDIVNQILDPIIQQNTKQPYEIKFNNPKPLKGEISSYKKPYFEMTPASSFKIRQIC